MPELGGLSFTGGCCATAREDILLEELDSWPGLVTLDVDPEQGVATVLVTPGHGEDLTAAAEALADRGLPVVVMDDAPWRPSIRIGGC